MDDFIASLVRKQAAATTVVQISDLHLTLDSDPANDGRWTALEADLRNVEADLLFVTGDLIDNPIREAAGDILLDAGNIPAVLDRVHKYLLEQLCPALHVDPQQALHVIPGNHDGRPRGLLTKSVSWTDFRNKFQSFFKPRLYPALKLFVYPFDSNTDDAKLNFATGRVAAADLSLFSQFVSNLRVNHAADWDAATRIALVHHHPLPIGASEKHRWEEMGLLFINAGQFLSAMATSEMDLVLHGHKHCAAHATVTLPLAGRDRTLRVISAGSVGRNDVERLSYHVMTIHDSGEIVLERRILSEALYQAQAPIEVVSYAAARGRLFERLARVHQCQLRLSRFHRSDLIKDRSGDVLSEEHHEGVTAFSARSPVGAIEGSLHSASGYFLTPRFENRVPTSQQVYWEWVDKNGQDRRSKTVFDPPVAGSRISYVRLRTTLNAVHFNRLDRIVSLRGSGNRFGDQHESVWLEARHACDQLTLQVTFPLRQFPSRIWAEARLSGPTDDTAPIEPTETDYIRRGFSFTEASRTAILTVEKPLPHYFYRIAWELPETDVDEPLAAPHDAGLAREIASRLLQLAAHPARKENVAKSLDVLQAGLSSLYPDPDATANVDLALYCYDATREAEGLMAVAQAAGGVLRSDKFAVGRTLVGQAHRRRETLLFQSATVQARAETTYEPTPSEDIARVPVVAIAVPLFWPKSSGLRVGVLHLVSHSNTCGLLKLWADSNQVNAEMIEQFNARILAWMEKFLLPALGL